MVDQSSESPVCFALGSDANNHGNPKIKTKMQSAKSLEFRAQVGVNLEFVIKQDLFHIVSQSQLH